MTKPITDDELNDLRMVREDGQSLPKDWWLVDALRERLRVAEMHAGSDREERQYWESRYTELRDRLALADAVVEAASEVMYPAKLAWTDERQKLHAALAVYRAAKGTT